jgi:hypothetical protein
MKLPDSIDRQRSIESGLKKLRTFQVFNFPFKLASVINSNHITVLQASHIDKGSNIQSFKTLAFKADTTNMNRSLAIDSYLHLIARLRAFFWHHTLCAQTLLTEIEGFRQVVSHVKPSLEHSFVSIISQTANDRNKKNGYPSSAQYPL